MVATSRTGSGIRDALLSLPCRSAIIDGEVVVARKNDGTPDFRALHSGNYSQENLCVWCFDLMEFNAEDLWLLPLAEGISSKLSDMWASTEPVSFLHLAGAFSRYTSWI